MNNIFDSHAHYDDDRFDEDRAKALSSLAASGVVGVINVGCDRATSGSSVQLSHEYPFVYAAVGCHPHSASEFTEGDIALYTELAQDKRVVAIGEIGLDYHYDLSPRDVQKEVFEKQLILANSLDMPVIIHSREATEDTIRLLTKHKPKGVVHCYSGSAEVAQQILALEMYIGYTGVVTFNNARRVLEAVRITPLDRLLLETDCPYMSPVPHRGERCDSTMIPCTADKIAEIKGIPVQQLVDAATENTRRLFFESTAKSR